MTKLAHRLQAHLLKAGLLPHGTRVSKSSRLCAISP